MSNISISLTDQLDEEITRLMRIEGYPPAQNLSDSP